MSLLPYEQQLRQDAIARAVASGANRARIMVAYDLTPAAFDALNRSDDFIDLVARYRERQALATQINAQFIESIVPKALRNVEQILDDPSDRKTWAATSMEVVKLGLPKSLDGATIGLKVEASAEAVAQLGEVFSRILSIREAMPQAAPLEVDDHLLPPGHQ